MLQTRTGDCNEHTQLFVALARAVGLPARIAAGLAFVDGKFYYHAWPEVLLNDWVAVDPTFGQIPANAAHLRFSWGARPAKPRLLRLMGNLKIDVLSVNEAPPLAGRTGATMIKLTKLTKRYGSFTAVNSIDLEVPRGELFVFSARTGPERRRRCG